MAQYKSEVLHRTYRKRLRPVNDYALGWLPRWSRLIPSVPGLARLVNAVLGVRPVERLVLRLGGMDTRRRIVSFAPSPWRRAFRAQGIARRTPIAEILAGDAPTKALPADAAKRDPATAGGPAAVAGRAPRPAGGRLLRRHPRPRGPARGREGPARGGLRGAPARARRVLRAHVDLDGPARRGALAARRAHGRARAVRRQRHPDRRARAVLHGRAALRPRGPVPERPARRRDREGYPHARRAAHRTRPLRPRRGVDAARPARRDRRRPAALPPARRHGLRARQGVPRGGRRDGPHARGLLRPRGQLRDGEGALRGLGQGRRGPAAPRARRGG